MELIEGRGPDGSEVQVDVSRGRVVIHLMTSSCAPCLAVWPTLRPGDVVVTPGPSTESRHRVDHLAPEGVTVVMSSEAWFALRPGPAPWRVTLLDGEVVESASAAEPGAKVETGEERAGVRSRIARFLRR